MLINNYVNIGIVTFNRLEFTQQAIASIVKYTSYPYIISVIDNASTDGTQDYLQDLQTRGIVKNVILLEENIGVAKASNLAWLQEPDSSYYLKYDNDIVIQKNNWLSSLVSVIDSVPEVGVIGYNFEPTSYPLKSFDNYQVRIKEEGNIGGACFLIPKRTNDILGYWCEEYGLYGFEDCDYSFRVRMIGLLNAYMEDENIGIHLPAGKAPIVNGTTWQTSDGIEEFKYKEYRNFKDSQMKDAIDNKIVSKKFDDYLNKRCSLYASAEINKSQLNFNNQKIEQILQGDLAMRTNQLEPQTLRVDLGCGINKDPVFFGVDVCPGPGVDIVADLNQPFPFKDNSVDEIRAYDAIEHLHDRLHTMNEIWRICKHGALIDIRVPSTDGRGAFQDPTHVSFWNINSFLYYCNDFPAYLELCQRYGFKGEFNILQLDQEESSGQVIHVIAKLQVVKARSDKSENQINKDTQLTISKILNRDNLQEFTVDDNISNQADFERTPLEILANIAEYQKEPSSRTTIANIRQLRYEFSNQWLNTPSSDLRRKYDNEFRNVYDAIVKSGIKNKLLTISEKFFVTKLVQNISENTASQTNIQSLLVVMLYYRADELLLEYDLSYIPDWLMSDYLKFLFATPLNFDSQGEADNYFNYIQGWMNYLHTSILSQSDSLFWQDIANKFAQTANFIPAYFNDTNLKDIYIKRADIIEFYLKNNECELDYQFDEQPRNRKKTRLGILASHYLPSAETFAALPAYEYLSREFEVVLYSLQETGDSLEQYCFSCANHHKLLPQGLVEQVNTIRADDLDILFFATNVTAVTNQICLLASHRLGRIQVTSGGSVVTTGMRHMDYFISGTLTDPSPTAQEQYREELLQLAGAAHCFSYGDSQVESTIEVNRESLDIAPETVIYISGANFFKIVPELVHTWAKIIAKVPNAALMLLPYGPNWSSSYPKKDFENNLIKILAEYGVSADRLIILDPQPVPNREGVKAYYQIADVCLDSYPFAGTTSLIEPLQVNLPVIARQGNSFRSSMGAAMIRSLDITELVADSEESYIQLAVALGNNPELRQQKSAEVKAKMADNPSFLDSKGYGSKIGELFKELVDRYSRDALSDNLRLRDVNLMVFPDWNQSEEAVGLELQQVIQTLATQSNSQQTTLLIDTTNIAIEDAQMFLSSVAMNLMMEEDLDIMEELEISLIEDLNNIQWENLLPRINARIVLECDNQEAVGKLSPAKLPQRQLESFILS
jgi:predicted O-linked N-acetylglucosamine transferase (SPINDLY family)/glycosyltransferase involved in cell wall biosynthesis